MVEIWRRRLPFLCGCALLLGMGAAVAADKTDLLRASSDDPRSGAALNVEAAKAALAAGKPPKAGPAPGPAPQIIFHSPVNNRFADLTPLNTQSTTSVLDLGGGNLVGAFNDSGSRVGGVKHFTGYAWSNNNGLSWTDPGRLPDSVGGEAGGSVLAHRKVSNTVLLATRGFSNGDPEYLSSRSPILQVFRSTDNGHTFLAPVNGAPGISPQTNQDNPWLAVDNFAGAGNGNAYLCWTRSGGGLPTRIFFTRSTNGGSTFFPSGGTAISAGGQGCFVAVSPNHQVNVFYLRNLTPQYINADNKIFLRRSTNQGLSFGAEVQVADLQRGTPNGRLSLDYFGIGQLANSGGYTNSFPQAAVNPIAARPYIYVVYNDTTQAVPSIRSDVYYVRSLDGGTSWSAPSRVNDDIAGDQYFPSVAFVNAGEQIMFGYYSGSHDAFLTYVFHRRGRLGALNAAGNPVLNPSFQLGPNTTSGNLSAGFGAFTDTSGLFIHEYDTIAGGAGAFSSMWSDNRLPPAAATGFPFQTDVRFARIVAPPVVADLAVTVATSTPTVNLGQNATLTVTATASGGVANDVFVNVPPAVGLIARSFNVASGTCNLINGILGCSLGPIPAGTSKTIQIVAATAVGAGMRIVTAKGTTSSAETHVANNTGSVAVGVAAGAAVPAAFITGNIAVPIYFPSEAPLIVPAAYAGSKVLNITASVRLNHTFEQNMRLFLQGPDGRTVPLAVDRNLFGPGYGSGANNCAGTRTTFTDLAATPSYYGSTPFGGSFKPEQSLLNTFVGSPANGVWKLIAYGGDTGTGTIGCFRLYLLRTTQ